MRRIFLKKLLIVFSFLAGTISIIMACGGDWEEPDVSSFTPETFLDSSPLFYSNSYFFYKGGFYEETEYNGRFTDTILSDWKKYLKKEIKEDDLNTLLVAFTSAEIDSLFAFYTKKEKNKIVKKWSAKINLKSKSIKSLIEFLHFAKKVEVKACNQANAWTYSKEKKAAQLSDVLINSLKEKFIASNDAFLKNRYWFQTVKAYFYSSNRSQTLSFFNKTAESVPHNLLYYRAMCYAAGAYYGTHQYSKSNYLYSIVFDECPELQLDATFGFHPQEETDWAECLALAKNNHQKSSLWALFGYYADEVKAIREIYNQEPKSHQIDFLLTRAINKEEKRINEEISYMEEPIESSEMYKSKLKDLQNEKLFELIRNIAQSGKTKTPPLWSMALGYLNILNGEFQRAKEIFNKIEQNNVLNPLQQNQLRLMRFINTLSTMDSIGTKEESILYRDLKWLYEECPKADSFGNDVFRYRATSDWSKKYISYVYNFTNEPIKRELFRRTDEIFSDEVGIMAMRNFLLKPDKSAYEKLAVGNYEVGIQDIDEFRMIRYGYENKIDEASAILKSLPEKYDYQFDGDPFIGNIKDCNDCDHQAEQLFVYNRSTLFGNMSSLKQKIKRKEEVYSNALKLANAFYNMSFFGNARVYYQGIIGSNGAYYQYYDAEYIPDYLKELLLGTEMSEYYYELALKHAGNNEQKAKCWYMLAKCERNDFYNTNYYMFEEGDEKTSTNTDFIAWAGFKELKTKFSGTKFYHDVIGECGYFSTYIKGH